MSAAVSLILRASLAACFAGHGVVALTVHAPWLAFFALFGIEQAAARVLMPLVGALDLVVAVLLLARPCRALYLWAAAWTLFTAILRPLAGGELIGLIARAANWAPPLALLLLTGGPRWLARADASFPSARARGLAMALLVLATAAIGAGFVVRGVGMRSWAIHGVLDVFTLLERAGVVGVPAALITLVVATARRRGC